MADQHPTAVKFVATTSTIPINIFQTNIEHYSIVMFDYIMFLYSLAPSRVIRTNLNQDFMLSMKKKILLSDTNI